MLTRWSQSFVTGDERIDAQHRELFRMINALHDANAQQRTTDTIDRIFRALERYVTEHLATEAEIMERTRYPGVEDHLGLHREITQRILSLSEQYRAGNVQSGIAVSQFLSHCLIEHIAAADKPMIDWVRSQDGVRRQSAQMQAVASPFSMSADSGGAQSSQSRLRADSGAAHPSAGELPVAVGQMKR